MAQIRITYIFYLLLCIYIHILMIRVRTHTRIYTHAVSRYSDILLISKSYQGEPLTWADKAKLIGREGQHLFQLTPHHVNGIS